MPCITVFLIIRFENQDDRIFGCCDAVVVGKLLTVLMLFYGLCMVRRGGWIIVTRFFLYVGALRAPHQNCFPINWFDVFDVLWFWKGLLFLFTNFVFLFCYKW